MMIEAIKRCGLVGTVLAIGACDQSEQAPSANDAAPRVAAASLPADPGERAATCYAARVVTFAEGPLTVEQANEAAHFILLGASTSGITEPTKVEMLQRVAKAAIPAVRQSGQAEAIRQSCGAAYPATTKAFAGLPADGRDTRMQCFTLAMGMTQIYDQSPQITGDRLARVRKLGAVLDDRMTEELRPNAGGNTLEIAGLATRSMTIALELGPITQVLDACAARYSP